MPWWSFTKAVLAAAALALVREGRIALDSRLKDQQFTLRQLLRHQASWAKLTDTLDFARGQSAKGDAVMK